MATECVELGFVEEVENPDCLTSPFFPSKVGGKPAWLARSGLPNSSSLLCKRCKKPLIFLLQVYVPSDEEELAFHRTVFVFCCPDGACYEANSNECFAAFRCQLPHANEFYELTPCEDQHRNFSEFREKESVMAGKWSALCEVCGCAGEKRCGKCHLMCYCSKEHQTIDWKRGHKLLCCKEAQDTKAAYFFENKKSSSPMFPEYELVTEAEEINKDKSNSSSEKNMSEYEKYTRTNTNSESETLSDREWESLAAETKKVNGVFEDKTYWEFKKRISHEPDQVLRYQRNGKPLWVSKRNIPSNADIPKCCCGAERTFEFQILPQLLNHLKVDSLQASIDWGTIAIYTCSKNCASQTAYSAEFVWKQDFSKSGLPADVLSKLQ